MLRLIFTGTSIAGLCATWLVTRSMPAKPEKLLNETDNAYLDAFVLPTKHDVKDVKQYARAFYTSRIFKFERFIIKHLIGAEMTDEQINSSEFNVGDEILIWKVVKRENNQVLLNWSYGSVTGSTWLKVENGKYKFGSGLSHSVGLLPTIAHQIYSRLLLNSAVSKMKRSA